MAIANSTETIEKLDYFDFANKLGNSIWKIHSLAIGADAIIERNDWEKNQDLKCAMDLIEQIKSKLEELASRLDASSYSYVLSGEKS